MNNTLFSVASSDNGRNTPCPLQGKTSARLRIGQRRVRNSILGLSAVLALASGGARADAVTDWNAIADTHATLPLPLKLRAIAMAQIAAHDALNAIDRRYETYTRLRALDPRRTPRSQPRFATC